MYTENWSSWDNRFRLPQFEFKASLMMFWIKLGYKRVEVSSPIDQRGFQPPFLYAIDLRISSRSLKETSIDLPNIIKSIAGKRAEVPSDKLMFCCSPVEKKVIFTVINCRVRRQFGSLAQTKWIGLDPEPYFMVGVATRYPCVSAYTFDWSKQEVITRHHLLYRSPCADHSWIRRLAPETNGGDAISDSSNLEESRSPPLTGGAKSRGLRGPDQSDSGRNRCKDNPFRENGNNQRIS